MYRGSRRLSFIPELRGYNSRVLWGMASGVVVVLGVVLDFA